MGTSEVSSEEFSGPEDGKVDSDGGRGRPISPVSPPPPRPAPAPNSMKLGLVENASPIDDEDFDIDASSRDIEDAQKPISPEPLETEDVSPVPFEPPNEDLDKKRRNKHNKKKKK